MQKEASTEIAELQKQVGSLQQELDLLHSEKSELVMQIERSKLESTERLALAENSNTELVNKIIEQERKLKEQEDVFVKLCDEQKQLEFQFQNSEENLKSSEMKIEEITQQFQNGIDAKNQEVSKLEEEIEELKRELEMKVEEISTLVENVRNTEVKLRLTNQKLRITEQLLSEKDESHLKKEEKLNEEHKVLEDRVATLSGIIEAYKEVQVKTITEITEKVNDTLTGVDAFSMKFEEDYGHLESRIYETVNELKVTTNMIRETINEKDQLKKEVANLVQQLNDEKDQESMLKGRISELESILHKEEDEKKSLIQSVQQRDEKMGELERRMTEKDMGLVNLIEEKREAIRQLCILIEYHRNRYDDLKDMVEKTRGARRQLAA